MTVLTGTPRKIFKVIFKKYKVNSAISFNTLIKIFPNQIELEDDLKYLETLNLIEHDYHWQYHLTSEGRIYFRAETMHSFETIMKSIICPVIVAFLTTLITLWLKGSL